MMCDMNESGCVKGVMIMRTRRVVDNDWRLIEAIKIVVCREAPMLGSVQQSSSFGRKVSLVEVSHYIGNIGEMGWFDSVKVA